MWNQKLLEEILISTVHYNDVEQDFINTTPFVDELMTPYKWDFVVL